MPRTTPSEHLIRQRLGALTRTLPAAREGDVDSLHKARVATRRLRETIPLVMSGSRQQKIDRKVRSLTRALGPVRELDVALQLLDELEGEGQVPRPAIARLRAALGEERRSLHKDMLRTVDRCDLDKLSKRAIAATVKAAGKTSPGKDPKHAAAARQRAARRAEGLQGAIANAAGLYLPDRLHEVRIAVKKLRYALEVAASFSRAKATARLRTLKKAQDLLGRMHDLEVLIARTRGVQSDPAAPLTLKLSGELDQFVRRLENECRQLHGQYIAMRAPLLAVCDYAVMAAHRATQPPKRAA